MVTAVGCPAVGAGGDGDVLVGGGGDEEGGEGVVLRFDGFGAVEVVAETGKEAAGARVLVWVDVAHGQGLCQAYAEVVVLGFVGRVDIEFRERRGCVADQA